MRSLYGPGPQRTRSASGSESARDVDAAAFVAGVDGGGTKTRLRCADFEGRITAETEFGPFNYNAIGAEAFVVRMREITDFLRKEGRCEALCIGAAGISNPQMAQAIRSACEAAGIPRIRIVGDHEIALRGALNDQAGVAVIAGTGSICIGRGGTDGRIYRVGGWGHLLGDEGSGYALGREVLRACIRVLDGYGTAGPLFELLAEHFGLTNREELIAYVYDGDKSSVAALAPLLERAAAAGDTLAVKIYEEQAEQLARQAAATAARITADGDPDGADGDTNGASAEALPVALLGGVLQKDKMLRSCFIAALKALAPQLFCIDPLQDALTGAVLLAQEARCCDPPLVGR